MTRTSRRAAAAFFLSAALATAAPAFAQDASTPNGTPIRITVGDEVMTGRLNDTTMAQRLAERLPATLRFGNHSGGGAYPTKVSRLEPELSTEGTELGAAPQTGDIAHYVPNGNLGFYYGPLRFWPGAVVLGTFDGDPAIFAERDEPFDVTIEVASD